MYDHVYFVLVKNNTDSFIKNKTIYTAMDILISTDYANSSVSFINH